MEEIEFKLNVFGATEFMTEKKKKKKRSNAICSLEIYQGKYMNKIGALYNDLLRIG